jgi:hypothetical protein
MASGKTVPWHSFGREQWKGFTGGWFGFPGEGEELDGARDKVSVEGIDKGR